MNTAKQNPTIDRVFKLARSAGYEEYSEYYAVHYMNPAFWQALGKALGWGVIGSSRLIEPMSLLNGRAEVGSQPAWLYHWHRFIDHIAEGKDADEFFKQLITPQ